MRILTGVVVVLSAVVINMAAAEIQARLDSLCFALLRLARRRLPAELRGPLHDEEWVPELHHILRGEEARPITRLVQGLAFSLGLLLKTKSVATEVGDSRSAPNASPEQTATEQEPDSTATLEAAEQAQLAAESERLNALAAADRALEAEHAAAAERAATAEAVRRAAAERAAALQATADRAAMEAAADRAAVGTATGASKDPEFERKLKTFMRASEQRLVDVKQKREATRNRGS